MECKFTVGQKVVCIDDDPHDELNQGFFGTLDGLTVGEIYTITDIYESREHGQVLVDIKEVDRKGNPFTNKKGYFHWRFKPLEEKKTDISIFKKLLTPSDEDKVKIRELDTCLT